MFTDRLFKRRKRAQQAINKFDHREVLSQKVSSSEVSYILSNDGELITISDPELLEVIHEHDVTMN